MADEQEPIGTSGPGGTKGAGEPRRPRRIIRGPLFLLTFTCLWIIAGTVLYVALRAQVP